MKIFLSYCVQDADYAHIIAEQLGNLRHEVLTSHLVDDRQGSWSHTLQAINQCSLFIIILSRRALESEARRLEYTFAHDDHKRILGVAIEEGQATKILSFSSIIFLTTPSIFFSGLRLRFLQKGLPKYSQMWGWLIEWNINQTNSREDKGNV